MKEAKATRKVLDLLRKMNYWQRIMILDWLKGWYEDQEQLEQEQMEEDYRDDCICKYDENNPNCPECY